MTTRRYRLIVLAAMAIGFALRLASAQGALWLDEAWSAAMARDVGTVRGVFVNINHDNNHHLNSLWLQAIGFGAPPWLARLPAILAGSAAVVVAAMIGARRGAAVGVVAAMVFAVAPPLVTVGSEARGYAGMELATLVAVLLADRAMAERDMASRALGIALCFVLGTLSQLGMAFAICAIGGWVAMATWQRDGWRAAMIGTLRLVGPGAIAAAALLAFVATVGGGMRFGDRAPFAWPSWIAALSEMLSYTFGYPVLGGIAIAAALVVLVMAWRARCDLLPFALLAVLAFPLTVATIGLINAGHPRYYLLMAIALLLLIAELAGRAMMRDGWRRRIAIGGIAVMLGGGLASDGALIARQRGDPGAAIRALRNREPDGTRVAIDAAFSQPVLEAAAASARYRLTVVDAPCPPQRFVFAEHFRDRPFSAVMRRCGVVYQPIARRFARGMSGTDWTLYERRP